MSSENTEAVEQEGNRVLFSGRTHAKILIGPVIIQLLMLALHYLTHEYLPTFGWEPVDRWLPIILHSAFGLIAFIFVVIPVLKWLNTKFVLTEDFVHMRWGIVRRRSREIQVERISQVETERTLIDYLFGCGTIYLSSPGLGGESGVGHVKMVDVPKIKKVIQMFADLGVSGAQSARK